MNLPAVTAQHSNGIGFHSGLGTAALGPNVFLVRTTFEGISPEFHLVSARRTVAAALDGFLARATFEGVSPELQLVSARGTVAAAPDGFLARVTFEGVSPEFHPVFSEDDGVWP